MFYQNFIGIDIGKEAFVVACHGATAAREYANTPSGIAAFIKDHKAQLADSLVVLETTGGYEQAALDRLCLKGYRVHRANTRKVKSFIRSYGDGAKTDRLDALALARYGAERHETLTLYTPPSKAMRQLTELARRRLDLKKMLVAEKNRYQAPGTAFTRKSIQTLLRVLQAEFESITVQMEKIAAQDVTLKAKQDVLRTIPGIGDVTALNLLVLVPELGQLNRREIASLAGLAPRACDSGKHHGYRRTGHGRDDVKPTLFMAAMAAQRSKSALGSYYESLVTRGKKPIVALTALMRKIIVIANAKIRDLHLDNKHS